MTGTLAADCLISALAGLALLGFRIRLRRVGLAPRLMRTLRFATGLWGVFYLLRVPAWLGQSDFGERLLLAAASLIPVSIVLVAEAALRRHAPPLMKWGVLLAGAALTLGAFVLPSSAAWGYLTALMAFQLVTIAAVFVFVWRFAPSLTLAEARQMRVFGVLALLSLPLVATDFFTANGGLHLSALAVLAGVWLILSSASWMTDMRVALCALGGLGLLALLGAWVLPGQGMAVFATVLAILIFAALLSEAARAASSGLSGALAAILARPGSELTGTRIAETLRGHDVVLIPDGDLSDYDRSALADRFRTRPLWTDPVSRDDLDDQLGALAKQCGTTHLLATGVAPLALVGFTLAPSQASIQVEHLLVALGHRMIGGDGT